MLYKAGRQLTGIEIKFASTWNNEFKKELKRFSEKLAPLVHSYVVYNGEHYDFSDGVVALPFNQVRTMFNGFDNKNI